MQSSRAGDWLLAGRWGDGPLANSSSAQEVVSFLGILASPSFTNDGLTGHPDSLPEWHSLGPVDTGMNATLNTLCRQLSCVWLHPARHTPAPHSFPHRLSRIAVTLRPPPTRP